MSTASPAERPARKPVFTIRQRLLLCLITGAAYWAARLVGPTLRWTVVMEEEAGENGPPPEFVRPAIYAFWHRCVFPAMVRYRDRQIAVMTSASFDGEYIARIIERFGFVAVRGSSSRGAVGALIGMHRELAENRAVAFTIDGPRGPRYVAKPGPILLASKTGLPFHAFHVALERAWVLNSWDALMIPKPFSRALVVVSRALWVPPDLSKTETQQYHEEMQAMLDRVRVTAETQMTALTGRSA